MVTQQIEPINIKNLSIKHCDLYIYLGSPFTSDGTTSSAIKAHAQEKIAHFYKFILFLNKNSDVPFIIKKEYLMLAYYLLFCTDANRGQIEI